MKLLERFYCTKSFCQNKKKVHYYKTICFLCFKNQKCIELRETLNGKLILNVIFVYVYKSKNFNYL